MAIQALNSAATGLRALSTSIDVTANNLANAETTAFKRSRTNFEDLMYQVLKQPGATNGGGDKTPAGIFVGLGVKNSNTAIYFSPGPLEKTRGAAQVGDLGAGVFQGQNYHNGGGGARVKGKRGGFFHH